VSPVAYAVLTLWAVIAGFFFVAYVGFYAQMQQYPDPQMLERLNLNAQIVVPFVQQLWIVVLLLVPGFPLINGVSDMVKGYINTGISRLVFALLLAGATCGGILLAMTVWNAWGWSA